MTSRVAAAIGFALVPYALAFGFGSASAAERASVMRRELGFLVALVVAGSILGSLIPRIGLPLALVVYYGGAGLVLGARVLATPSAGRIRSPSASEKWTGRVIVALIPTALLLFALWPAIDAIVNAFRTATPVTVFSSGDRAASFSITKDSDYRGVLVVTGVANGCQYSTVTLSFGDGSQTIVGGAAIAVPKGSSRTQSILDGKFTAGTWTVQVNATNDCAWGFMVTPE